MVRPRLVEEGVPIGSTLGPIQADDDHVMLAAESGSIPQHAQREYRSAPEPHHNNYHSCPHDTATATQQRRPNQQQSSLWRAAGGRISAPKRPMRATRLVIGGERHNGDDGDHAMDLYNEIQEAQRGDEHQPSTRPVHIHPIRHRPIDTESHTVADNHPCVNPTSLATTYHRTTPHQHPSRPDNHPAAAPSSFLSSTTRTHVEIGADTRVTEKMTGVEDHSIKGPLVVLDGANVAYAYAQAMHDLHLQHHDRGGSKLEPDVRGIQVACDYFGSDVRVLVVLPQSYYRRKPGGGGGGGSGSSRAYHDAGAPRDAEQSRVLGALQRAGRLVAAPPADDDDAYALQIARRENARARQRRGTHSSAGGHGPAFVLSNDLFRDAQQRDTAGHLSQWLNRGIDADYGPGRISFAFCDMGRIDDHGDPELDIIPNPRHPLVSWVEQQQQQQQSIDTTDGRLHP